jgi:hypothetical protein
MQSRDLTIIWRSVRGDNILLVDLAQARRQPDVSFRLETGRPRDRLVVVEAPGGDRRHRIWQDAFAVPAKMAPHEH